MPAEYSLYILRCTDDSLYTGIALDVERRFEEHLQGKRGAKYFGGRQPVEIVFTARVGNRSRASRIEHRVKRLSRAQKIRLVSGQRSLPDPDAQASGSESAA